MRKLHKFVSDKSLAILKFKTEGARQDGRGGAKEVNEQYNSKVLQMAKPGALMNFDLVFLSPKYKEKMEQIMNYTDAASQPDRSNYFEVKNLFNDWTHMTLREDLMQRLQAQLMPDYCRDEQLFLPDDATDEEIVLVSQQCWSKITYVYG